MKKRLIAGLMISSMIFNISVFAEDYWTKVNENIQTGIGSDETTNEVQLGNIEDYIKNGWSSEFAEIKEQSGNYVSPYQNEIDLVVRLGLMSPYPSGFFGDEVDFKPQEKLSYYDYAKTLKNLTKYSSIDTSALENVQNIVTCSAVIKDMVTLLGYDYFADEHGKSYLSVAEDYGILDGISLRENEAVTREQFAKVVANCLDIDMLSVKIGETIIYEITEENTFLLKMNVEKIQGWVNATENINMYSINPSAEGRVQINGAEYYIGESGAKDYLGRYVTAYVKEEDGEKTVIKIDLNEKKDNFLMVADSDIDKITKDSLTYIPLDEEGNQTNRRKTEKFSLNGNVIYNGKLIGTVAGVDEDILMPKNGEINIADTDFDGQYDVIFIWNYEVYVVEQVSGTRVLMKNNKGILDLSDDTKKVILSMDGEEIKVSELAQWNVLSVAKTLDDKMYTIIGSSQSIAGVYKSKDEDEIILEDSIRCKLDKSFFGDLEFNKEYRFYFTHLGKAAACDIAASSNATKTGTGRNYAYLRKCYYSDDSEDAASFRIFRLSDSKWLTLEGAEKINFYSGAVENEENNENKNPVNKQRITAKEAADNLTTPQLIVFETDIYGKISSISTAVDYTQSGELNDNVFAHNMHREDKVRTYYGGYFGGIYHRGTCLLLRVPEDRSQEKYYALETISADGGVNGPMDIYDVNESMVINGVIVRYTSSSSGISNTRGDARITIDKIQTVEDGDDIVYKITALGGNEYYVRDDDDLGQSSLTKKADSTSMYNIKKASELKKGDMLCADVDDLGYITAFRVDVRISELKSMEHFSYTSGDSPAVLTYDYGVIIKNNSGSNVVINTSGDASDETKNKPRVVNNIMYSYDSKTGKFERIDKSDILPGDILITRAVYYYTGVEAIVIK